MSSPYAKLAFLRDSPDWPADIPANFLTGIAEVISLPHSLTGLLPGLFALASVLEALEADCPRPGLPELINDVRRLHGIVSSHQSLPGYMRAAPDDATVNRQFSVLLAVISRGKNYELARDIRCLFGVVFLHALLKGMPLTVQRAQQLSSLLRWSVGRSNDGWHWHTFAASMSVDPSALKRAANASRLKTIRNFGEWLAELLQTIQSNEVPPTATFVNLYAKSVSVAQPLAEDDETAAKTPEPVPSTATEDKTATEVTAADEGRSLILWSYRRANNGSALASASLIDWNLLSPVELKRAISRVLPALGTANDSLEVRLAIAAGLSLATNLPIDMLLKVPLAENGDLWIDVAHRQVAWNLDRLVEREIHLEAIVQNGFRPASTVRVALPLSVARPLQAVGGKGTSIGQYLFEGLPAVGVASRFGSFLRSGAWDDPRKPYSARFAYSLGGAIAHVTNDTVAAAFGAADFRHLAPSEIHYLCVPSSRINDALEKTYLWLGMGSTREPL